MSLSSTTRDLVENGNNIISEFGYTAYLGCFAKAALKRREVSFLELIMELRELPGE
jgi:hypothetical protein